MKELTKSVADIKADFTDLSSSMKKE